MFRFSIVPILQCPVRAKHIDQIYHGKSVDLFLLLCLGFALVFLIFSCVSEFAVVFCFAVVFFICLFSDLRSCF